MNPFGSSPAPPGLIRLHRTPSGAALVRTAPQEDRESGSTAALFEPFLFPPLPLSLHCWCTALANEFYERHHRCIAAWLILDCQHKRWVHPVIPAQACSSDGSCWTLELGSSLPPNRRVAGSFQSRSMIIPCDAVATVPPVDGLHIVQIAIGTVARPFSYWFIRIDGQILQLDSRELTCDDWALALSAAEERMTFK